MILEVLERKIVIGGGEGDGGDVVCAEWKVKT